MSQMNLSSVGSRHQNYKLTFLNLVYNKTLHPVLSTSRFLPQIHLSVVNNLSKLLLPRCILTTRLSSIISHRSVQHPNLKSHPNVLPPSITQFPRHYILLSFYIQTSDVCTIPLVHHIKNIKIEGRQRNCRIIGRKFSLSASDA